MVNPTPDGYCTLAIPAVNGAHPRQTRPLRVGVGVLGGATGSTVNKLTERCLSLPRRRRVLRLRPPPRISRPKRPPKFCPAIWSRQQRDQGSPLSRFSNGFFAKGTRTRKFRNMRGFAKHLAVYKAECHFSFENLRFAERERKHQKPRLRPIDTCAF